MDRNIGSELLSAVRYGQLQKVEALISTVDLSKSPELKNGYQLLESASEKDHTEIIELLLKSGCDVNDPSTSAHASMTPLHWAAKNGRGKFVEMLLDRNADPNARDETGKTPLRYAIDHKITKSRSFWPMNDAERIEYEMQMKLEMDTIESLLTRGADASAATDKGVTPLHYAVIKLEPEIATMLLNNGADVDSRTREKSYDEAGFTPLHCAVQRQSTRLVKMLLENRADPNIGDAHGRTALHLACTRLMEENVQELLNHGADVHHSCSSSKQFDGYTALHFAASHSDSRIAELLLDNGANVDARTIGDNLTPLHVAICPPESTPWTPFVDFLIARGADVDARNKKAATALQMAVETGVSRLVESVLKGQPDLHDEGNRHCVKSAVKALNGKKKTPRYLDAEEEYARIIEMLLEYGFPIDSEDAKNTKL